MICSMFSFETSHFELPSVSRLDHFIPKATMVVAAFAALGLERFGKLQRQ